MNRLALIALMILNFCDPAISQQIVFKDCLVELQHDKSILFAMSAESKGDVKVGSYVIRLDECPGDGKYIPNSFFKSSDSYAYYSGKDYPADLALLFDNGVVDGDPNKGVFRLVVPTENWKDGEYVFCVSAMNRPGDGECIAASRNFVIRLGDKDLVEGVSPKEIKNITIYKKAGAYSCFPELFQLPDGRLITTFSTRIRPSHIEWRGGSVSLVSSDGIHWTETNEPMIDKKWLTKEGTLLTASADAWIHVPVERTEELIKRGKTTMSAGKEEVAYLGGAHSRLSKDGGKTWEVKDINLPNDISGLNAYNKGASEILTSKGVRLIATYGRRIGCNTPDSLGPDEVFFLRYEPDKNLWNCIPLLANCLPIGSRGFDEVTIQENQKGEVIAMIRTAPQGFLFESISTDQGLTWSEPQKSNIWGFPGHLLKLSDGRMICTYGYRRFPGMGIRARISSDGGRTWPNKEYVLRSDGMGNEGDTGYPITVQMKNGKLFTIYYITNDDGITHLAGSLWDID